VETRARELKVVLRESVKTGVSVFVLILVGGVTTGVAHAQPRRDCSAAGSTGVGLSVGRSLTPLFELSPGTFEAIERGSLHPGPGLHLGGRVDQPIAGPWRGRVEVSGSNWPVEHQIYDANFNLVERSTLGHVESRQILAFVGRQGGRSAACGYVLAGGGLFSLRVEEARVWRPGAALAAGVEMPITGSSALQVEAQVHMIGSGAHPPMATGALAANLSVGWLHRF
jgi:hypothetical protein